MEVPGTTSAPAGGASAPSAPPPSAPSAPASTSSPSSTPYGTVPKESAKQLFDKIDADLAAQTQPAATTPAAGTAPAETPEGTTALETEAPADPNAATTGTENEASLPPALRESLKSVQDPKVRRYLADAAFMRQTFHKTGLPFQTAVQFLQDAPAYLQKAPTLDVLNEMSRVAGDAETIAGAYHDGSPEGFQNFTRALVQSDPATFVGYLGFLFSETENLSRLMTHHFGAEIGGQIRSFANDFMDNGMRNVVARMRRDAAGPDPDKAVLGEVADELEKYLGLKQAPVAPRGPDARDREIQRLRAADQQNREMVRNQFMSGVTNQAGNVIDKEINALIQAKGSALPKKAQETVSQKIGERLYALLLPGGNAEIERRVNAINASGRWDGPHAKELFNFYVNAGKRLLPAIAVEELRNMAELTGTALVKREERVQNQQQRRDTGASGSPVSPSAGPVLKPNMTPKEMFAELDRAAGQAV